MFTSSANNVLVKNTSWKVVVPFYVYAALSFLAATILLFFSFPAFTQHYFHPQTLAVTHVMALGWGTMVILGASHQLIPVLVEGKLYSNALAYLSFVTAAVGIPLLIVGFYNFYFGWLTQLGGILINAAILCYLVNIAVSMSKSKKENVHAVFAFTASLWLLMTTLVGLFLIYNFTYNLLSKDSLAYLPLHAHLGIIGWFLLFVIGVGSRLIPMFLISKYDNKKLLWRIYYLINFALIVFIICFLYININWLYLIPLAIILLAVFIFGWFCYNAYANRLRKKVDSPLKVSLLSVVMMMMPLVILFIIISVLLFSVDNFSLVLTYGFCIFFGWITAIIFGMTFKTLPFMLWNKAYHGRVGMGKTPSPKELFSSQIFKVMVMLYLAGFVMFIAGIFLSNILLLKVAACLLFGAAVLYNGNVFKMVSHTPEKS